MELETIDNLDKVDPSQWDAMVPGDDPFLEHAFLLGLERSGSVGPADTGWIPRHIVARDGEQLVGAMPLYEKTHSYGEFIFDWDWAAGAQRAGIPYYPKLVGAVPFTPVSGARLLVAPGQDLESVQVALAEGARDLAGSLGALSVHILFLLEQERSALVRCGWLGRSTHQYHWAPNPAWTNFEDYLAGMKARHRKQIRRERREVAAHNLELCVKRGEELGEQEWRALWQFYLTTISRKWSYPYLNQAFFDYLRDVVPHRVLVTLAYRDERPIGGALFLTRGDALFGRYWGATEPLEYLHFELCYYLPLEWCLENGINRFETGAQGEHKIKRGFLPQMCSSVHWFEHQGMSNAVEGYLSQERAHSDATREALERYSPFRSSPDERADE